MTSLRISPMTVGKVKGACMSNFFPMSRGDLLFVVTLLLFALVSFLPWSRDAEWAGMAMLGWMMAALMVLSPAIALVRLFREKRRDGTGGEGGES